MFRRNLKYEKKFWEEEFTRLKNEDLQLMQKFIRAWIERFWKIPKNARILEIGGQGGHLLIFFNREKNTPSIP